MLLSHLRRAEATSLPSADRTKGHGAPAAARAARVPGLAFWFVRFCCGTTHRSPAPGANPSSRDCLQGLGWDIGRPQAAPQGSSPERVPACCLRGFWRCLWCHPVCISTSLFLGQIVVITHGLFTLYLLGALTTHTAVPAPQTTL